MEKYNITARGTTVTPSIKEYIENKFAKFEKYIKQDFVTYVKIEVKNNGNRHKIAVTIPIGKQVIHAEEEHTDMYAAIDAAEKTIVRCLRKRKEKFEDRKRRSIAHTNDEPKTTTTEMSTKEYVVKTKLLEVFDKQEACEAMEMLGDSFFAYKNDDGDVCVMYLKEDGTYESILFR